MNRHVLILVIVMLGLAVLVGGATIANAQQNNTTTTPVSTPTVTPTATPTSTPTNSDNVTARPGPGHSIETLDSNGVSNGDSPVAASTRFIGDPPRGFVGIRYKDPSLLTAISGDEAPWVEISPTGIIEQDTVQLYGSAFGNAAGRYELVIVYWQEQNTDNGTIAANQAVDRQGITFGLTDAPMRTYDIPLREHLDDTWRVTMWLERNGEPVPGAQWTARHRTNPESAAIDVNSQAEAWGYAARTTGIPAAISVIIGIILSQATLRRTGRGPGWGVGGWLFVVGFAFMILASVAYYQIAMILNNAPYVIGITVGVIAYAGGLTYHQPEKKIGFFRRELIDAITIPGGSPNHKIAQAADAETDGGQTATGREFGQIFDDLGAAERFEELTESIFVDLPTVPAVRTDNDEYRVPVKGLRPFFARLFADAASMDVGSIATRIQVKKGDLSDIIMVDPMSEEAVIHEPAKLVRALPWNTKPDNATWVQELIAAALSAVIIAVPPIGLTMVFDQAANIPMVGFVIGVLITIILSYSAQDGDIKFEAAPEHYERAEDNLTVFQRVYKATKEDASAKDEARRERATTVSEAREDRLRETSIVSDKLLEALGIDSDDGDSVIDKAEENINETPDDEESDAP